MMWTFKDSVDVNIVITKEGQMFSTDVTHVKICHQNIFIMKTKQTAACKYFSITLTFSDVAWYVHDKVQHCFNFINYPTNP